jgi:type I restriction enzyme, S subunit
VTMLSLEECMSAIIDYRGKTPRKTTTGVPLITAKVVKGGRIETPDEFIDADEYEEWMRRGLPQVGDVVITTEAPLGEVAQLSESRIALAQRLILLRGKPGLLDNTYLKYLLMSGDMQEQLVSRASGTTVVGIKQSELRKVTLSLPPIDEQQAIAAVLGVLDDKIDQNRRTGRALERLARATFKAWFVDFEPVKAKAAGQTSFPGMPPATFAAVPKSFVDSEFGPVPHGWHPTDLGREFEFQVGFAFKSAEFTDALDGIRLVRGDNVKEGWIEWGNKTRRWNDLNEKVSQYNLAVGDVVIGMDGSKLGKNWSRVREIDLPSLLVQRVARFRSNGAAGPSLMWLLISHPRFCEFVDAVKTGTSIPHVSGGQLKSFSFVKPGVNAPSIWSDFEHSVSPLLTMADQTASENIKLVALRDYLLPRLLSGRVRVRDSEKIRSDA